MVHLTEIRTFYYHYSTKLCYMQVHTTYVYIFRSTYSQIYVLGSLFGKNVDNDIIRPAANNNNCHLQVHFEFRVNCSFTRLFHSNLKKKTSIVLYNCLFSSVKQLAAGCCSLHFSQII